MEKKEWGRESKASMFYFKITISSKIYADFLLCILFLNKFKINLFFSDLQQLLQLLILIIQGIGGSHETVHLKNKLYLKKKKINVMKIHRLVGNISLELH